MLMRALVPRRPIASGSSCGESSSDDESSEAPAPESEALQDANRRDTCDSIYRSMQHKLKSVVCCAPRCIGTDSWSLCPAAGSPTHFGAWICKYLCGARWRPQSTFSDENIV